MLFYSKKQGRVNEYNYNNVYGVRTFQRLGAAPQHSNTGFLSSFLFSGSWSTSLHMTALLRSVEKI